MRRMSWIAIGVVACGPGSAREMVPATMVEETAGPRPLDATAGEVFDRGELVLRSKGEEIGRETFSFARAGKWLEVKAKGRSTFPDPLAIDFRMLVDPETWVIEGYDLGIEHGGRSCAVEHRVAGDTVEVAVRSQGGARQVLDREGREHALFFVSIRPAVTQGAICAIADGEARALDSFAPWYVVRTAPREATALPTADGARKLERVKVDELIDVYCDGKALAIVHYGKHAFTAARAEYDAAARELAKADPQDEPWAGALACPSGR